MTADELSRLPRGYGVRYELVGGVLRTMPAGGMAHGLAAANILMSFGDLAERRWRGYFVAACGFQLAWNPDTVLAPDAAFIAKERAVETWGYFPGHPDFAAEVVNFDEACADMERRADDWIAAGTRLVVVADPRTKAVVVVTPEGKRRLSADDVITGGEVLPGWSLPARDIFRTCL
jgi:Uma2 family endonuclease